MPAHKSTSGFAKKYGAKVNNALKESAAAPPEYNKFGDLPPGISGGAAQLTECKFDVYKKGEGLVGEYYFMAMGCVISPSEGPKGEQIKGLFTKIGPMPCCQSKNKKGEIKSQEQNVQAIQNELKKLGAAAESIDSAEGMESTAAALKQMAPYFKFSTSRSEPNDEYPNPKTWENWFGTKGLENFSPEDSSPVDDNSPQVDEQPAEDQPTDDEPDLDALATTADDESDGECENAKLKLTELAKEKGVDEDAISSADNWGEVAELIKNAGEAPAEPEKPFEPTKGMVAMYKPPKSKKAVECNIDLVDKKSKKVNLTNLDDGKTIYKGVPYSELSKVK